MDDAIDLLPPTDVVSPVLQATGRMTASLSVASPRSPSCGPPQMWERKMDTISSVYAQRHKSTPSRRRRPAALEPVASPLRLVSTQEPNLLSRFEKDELSDSLSYAAILQKKESLRKLLSELPTSPQAKIDALSPLGRLNILKVSPVKGELVVTSLEPPKTSVALSPLIMKEIATTQGPTDADSYLRRIAELEEKLMQREAEMKELMVAVLSDDLTKESSKDREIASLTEKLKRKEDELLQVLELVSNEQSQRVDKCSVGTQTKPASSQARSKPVIWKEADAKKVAEIFCHQCHEQAVHLLTELKEIVSEKAKRAIPDQPGANISGNNAKKPLKRVTKTGAKDAPVHSKSVPVRKTKEVKELPLQDLGEQHQKEAVFSDQSLSQFMLSPEISVAASSDSCVSIKSAVFGQTTTLMERFINTSVSTMSEMVDTSDIYPKLGREVKTEDPLFDTVFDILTEVAK